MNKLTPLAIITLLSCGGTEPGPSAPAPEPAAATAAPTEGAAVTRSDDHSAANAERDRRLSAIERRVADIEDRLEDDPSPPPPTARRPSAPRGPDPSVVYAVPIDGNGFRGAADARITIVKGFEFACPFCYKSRTTIDQLLKDYKGDIKVVYKSYVVHPQVATAPAVAACAAGKQGKFHKMATAIWKHGFDKYRAEREPKHMSAANMRRIARRHARLKIKKYDKALADCEQKIAQDAADLSRVGVTGTPAFFINGRYLRGAQPLSKFKTLIDEELLIANDRISAGDATAATYYEIFVMGKGKKSL